MNWSGFFKRLLPHVIVVLIFIAVTFFFLSPMLKGKVLPQNDIRQWQGSFQETKAYQEKTGERTLWTNSMFGGMPTYQIAPYSPNSLIGSRVLYNILVSGWSLPKPANAIFLYCFGFYLLLLAFRINPWLALGGALAYGLSSFNIVIIEAGHMLQAYALGTGPMVLAAAVYTIRWRKYVLGGALFALALAIHLATNHPQIAYYTAIVMGFYLLAELINHIRENRILDFGKAAGVFAIGAVIAVGSTATFLITTEEYSKETIRGKSDLTSPNKVGGTGLDRDYAFGWSSSPGEAPAIVIPNFRGGQSGSIGQDFQDDVRDLGLTDQRVATGVMYADRYWGMQPSSSGPAYMGAVVIFLFVMGLFFLKGIDKWWISAVLLFGMLLSWGDNFPGFNYFMFDHFPLYNKFRSVNFAILMGAMVAPILGMLVVQKIAQNFTWNKETRKRFFMATGIAGGFCLLFFLLPDMAGDFLKYDKATDPSTKERTYVESDKNDLIRNPYFMQAEQLTEADAQKPEVQGMLGQVVDGARTIRENLLTRDAIRSAAFILLAAAVLYLFLTGRIKKEWMFAGLAVLIVADLFSVGKRYLRDELFVRKSAGEAQIFATDADNYILGDPDPDYRVVNVAVNTFNDATTSYFHKSIGGYHGAKLRRIQDLIEHQLGNEVGMIQQNLQKVPPASLLDYMYQTGNLSALDMLNTKYIIAGQTRDAVIVNPHALGHAWFVRGIKTVENADAEIAAMDHFNPRDTAIIDINIYDKKFGKYLEGFKPSTDTTGTIKLTSYKPNELTYESNTSAEQLAVFAEMYYNSEKGWNVYVDGQKKDHIRANFILRAMRVPAGKHTIVFKFEPSSFAKGEKITLVASLALLLGLFGAIYYEWRRRNGKPAEKQAA